MDNNSQDQIVVGVHVVTPSGYDATIAVVDGDWVAVDYPDASRGVQGAWVRRNQIRLKSE